MSVVLMKKVRCQGCKALTRSGNDYKCSLGFGVDSRWVNGEAISPRPKEKCYKPKNHRDLKKAEKLVSKK